MKSFALVLAFLATSTIVVVNGQIITAAVAGSIIAAAVGLKIVAGLGFAAGAGVGFAGGRRNGGRRFGKRSAADAKSIMLEASLDDAQDCAKKLVCTINAKPTHAHGPEEKAIYSIFGNQVESLDVSQDTVEFELAALMGRRVGVSQCNKIYARCPFEQKTLLEAIQSSYYENL
jgi:hypothetical protein